METNFVVCNFAGCPQLLKSAAWVTLCSHMYCDEHGTTHVSVAKVCPKCDTPLPGDNDMKTVNLKPSEQWKSMVLAGLDPETTMEICQRSISVWKFQASLRRMEIEHSLAKKEERLRLAKIEFDDTMKCASSEMDSLSKENHKMRSLNNELGDEILRRDEKLRLAKIDFDNTYSEMDAREKEIQKLRSLNNELRDDLTNKARDYQTLQRQHEDLRRRGIRASVSTPHALGGRGEHSGSNTGPVPFPFNPVLDMPQ